MSWSNDASHPAQARVLRGPRVSSSRPASLLVDPEQLRLYQKPDESLDQLRGDGSDDTGQGDEEPGHYVRDPEEEARELEELSLRFDAIREESFHDGYEKGLIDGRIAAEEEFEKYKETVEERRNSEIASASKALLGAVERVEEARSEAVLVAERDCIDLAYKLTRALLNRELQLTESPVLDSITRALSLAPTNEAVLIKLNPSDISVLSGFDVTELGRECTIVEDPQVEHGGCVVQVGPTTIDSQLSHALGRVRKALLGMGHVHHVNPEDVTGDLGTSVSRSQESNSQEIPHVRPYLVGTEPTP